MGAHRNRIFLLVLNLKMNTRREIPYLQATIYYVVYDINILTTSFLTISDHFTKISEDPPKIVRRPHERFRPFLKITEDNRKVPR